MLLAVTYVLDCVLIADILFSMKRAISTPTGIYIDADSCLLIYLRDGRVPVLLALLLIQHIKLSVL